MSISIGPDIVIGRRMGVSLSGGSAAAPWWLSGGISEANAVAVYQPIGAASLAASYVNLANPGTYDAAPGVAPTFDTATGWTFNGTTQYLGTGVVPALNQTWSAIVRFSDASGTGILLGMLNGVATKAFLIWRSSGRRYYNGGNLTRAGDAPAAAVMAISGNKGYLNGVAETGTIAAGTDDPGGYDIWISGYNSAGSLVSPLAGKIQAIAIYNATLTADQVAAVTTAMAAL